VESVTRTRKRKLTSSALRRRFFRRRWGAGRAPSRAGCPSGSTSGCTRSWRGRSSAASSATRSSSTSPASVPRSAPPASPAPTRLTRGPLRRAPTSAPSPIDSASPAPRTSGTRTTGPSTAPSGRRVASSSWSLGGPGVKRIGRIGMIWLWSSRGLWPGERGRAWPPSIPRGSTEQWRPGGRLLSVSLLPRGGIR